MAWHICGVGLSIGGCDTERVGICYVESAAVVDVEGLLDACGRVGGVGV